jgi:hypothetical protein
MVCSQGEHAFSDFAPRAPGLHSARRLRPPQSAERSLADLSQASAC